MNLIQCVKYVLSANTTSILLPIRNILNGLNAKLIGLKLLLGCLDVVFHVFLDGC